MANIFGPLASYGRGFVRYVLGTGPLEPGGYSYMGLNMTADGRVQCSSTEPITHWANGLPFTADGRLARGGGAAARHDQGVGFTGATNRVSMGTGLDHYDQGVGFTLSSNFRSSSNAPFLAGEPEI